MPLLTQQQGRKKGRETSQHGFVGSSSSSTCKVAFPLSSPYATAITTAGLAAKKKTGYQQKVFPLFSQRADQRGEEGLRKEGGGCYREEESVEKGSLLSPLLLLLPSRVWLRLGCSHTIQNGGV